MRVARGAQRRVPSVAIAANNLAPVALQYAGRWIDDRVLELERPTTVAGRRQRVRYTKRSDAEMEFW